MKPRYWRQYQRAYQHGLRDATDALRRFLEAGGDVAPVPFDVDALAIRTKGGVVAEIRNLAALRPFDPDEPMHWPTR